VPRRLPVAALKVQWFFSQTNAAQVPSTISATANMLISKYFYLIERSGMTFALPLFKQAVRKQASGA
jgi:hypothetical protein